LTEPEKEPSKEPKEDTSKERKIEPQCIPPIPDNPLYIASLMSYHEKHTLGNIILSYKKEEQPIVEMLKRFSVRWFDEEFADTLWHVNKAVEQFFEHLNMGGDKLIDEMIERARKSNPNVGVGPVSGINRYHSDKSRTDGKLIRRKRR
tara:strand:+ start:678 stop:1121 length:444 start_codon:yes stop_codon:yes gene_type:complete